MILMFAKPGECQRLSRLTQWFTFSTHWGLGSWLYAMCSLVTQCGSMCVQWFATSCNQHTSHWPPSLYTILIIPSNRSGVFKRPSSDSSCLHAESHLTLCMCRAFSAYVVVEICLLSWMQLIHKNRLILSFEALDQAIATYAWSNSSCKHATAHMFQAQCCCFPVPKNNVTWHPRNSSWALLSWGM